MPRARASPSRPLFSSQHEPACPNRGKPSIWRLTSLRHSRKNQKQRLLAPLHIYAGDTGSPNSTFMSRLFHCARAISHSISATHSSSRNLHNLLYLLNLKTLHDASHRSIRLHCPRTNVLPNLEPELSEDLKSQPFQSLSHELPCSKQFPRWPPRVGNSCTSPPSDKLPIPLLLGRQGRLCAVFRSSYRFLGPFSPSSLCSIVPDLACSILKLVVDWIHD